MILSQEPVEGYYLMIWLDGIENEHLTNKADVPTHPVDQASSVSDHSVKGNQAYSVNGYLGTPLQGDNVTPQRNGSEFTSTYGDKPVLIAPPAAVTQGILGQPIFNDRGTSLMNALERILGIPLDIYSPRYGKLRGFVMTSYSDQRNGTSKIPVDMSFQQIRRPSVERVIVPKVPRARNQEKPAAAGSSETAKNGTADDRSNLFDLFARDGGRVDPNNPNSPSRGQRLGELIQDLPEGLMSGIWEGVSGTGKDLPVQGGP